MKDLSVLGCGECGSAIAFELSVSFNPLAALGLDVAKLDTKISFSLFKSKKERPKLLEPPKIYIADLNEKNNIYHLYNKAVIIRDYLIENHETSKSVEDILTDIANAHPEVGISPRGEQDKNICETIRNNKHLAESIRALHFTVNGEPLTGLGGAGGLQVLSEVIAYEDDQLFNGLDPSSAGIIFGIFSIGGGTGAGSVFSILSKYKKNYDRYTIGIGILPSDVEDKYYCNSGRYITKFVSTDISERFHTLITFSNQAARNALRESSKDNLDSNGKEIINEYVREFISDFALMNDENTKTTAGKSFDPMDGKRYFNGTASVGYATSEDVDVADLFCQAVSPMQIKNNSLSGLSVMVAPSTNSPSADAAKRKKIIDLVKEIFSGINNDDSELNEKIDELSDITPFYRTIKSVWVSLFIKDEGSANDIIVYEKTIASFFKRMAGDKTTVTVNCYCNPRLDKNSMQIICQGGLPPEVLSFVFDYVEGAFFSESDEGYFKFTEGVFPILKNSKGKISKEDIKRLHLSMEDELKTHTLMPASENVSNIENDIIKNNKIINGLLSDEGLLDSRLVKKEHVTEVMKHLISSLATEKDKIDAAAEIF